MRPSRVLPVRPSVSLSVYPSVYYGLLAGKQKKGAGKKQSRRGDAEIARPPKLWRLASRHRARTMRYQAARVDVDIARPDNAAEVAGLPIIDSKGRMSRLQLRLELCSASAHSKPDGRI